MKTPVKLKVKNETKFVTINNLFTDSTLNELINEIRKFIDIDMDTVELLNGYPPKAISMNSLVTKLSEVNIVSGDSIIVKMLPSNSIKRPRLHIMDDAFLNIDQQSRLNEHQKILDDQNEKTILIVKDIPPDNSCLFASIHYCLNDGSLTDFNSLVARQLIADVLLNNRDMFTEAYLDNKTTDEYSEWIKNTNNWGGSIELSLLSKMNGIEIDVVNCQYNRVDRFGESEQYSHRILIFYDGIHYDALAREYLSDGRHETRFSITDQEVLSQADQLAREARASKQFTDLHRFSVKCLDCDQIIYGQDAVAKHAKETGHSHFGEVHNA